MAKSATEIKWIKIATNIFSDEKILLIEQMPDADTILVIWFKLLCMAGKENNCGVFVMGNKFAYTDEMLATIFRRNLQTIRLALSTFEAFGMIEIIEDPYGNDVYTIPNWEKHQNIDGMDKIREQNRIRKQNQRQRQKQLAIEEKNHVKSRDSHAIDKDKEKEKEEEKEKEYIIDGFTNTRRTNVGQMSGHFSPEIEKEIEIETEIEQEPETDDPQSGSMRESYQEIVAYLNDKAGTGYKASSKKTQTCIRARIEEGFEIDDFKTVIDKKCMQWIGTEFEKFLRPETLFGTKFEGYLNEKYNPKQSRSANIQNRVNDIDNW